MSGMGEWLGGWSGMDEWMGGWSGMDSDDWMEWYG